MNTLAVFESFEGPKLMDNSYRLMLRESIDHFLAEYKRGCSDFSAFGTIFFRLVQKMSDPPLEIIWFYSAVTFHTSVKSITDDPSKKVIIAAKDLFQLIVSCSSPCNGVKRVAVLAPLLYELYYIVFDCPNKDLCLKREIEGLVEGIVSYICLCCSNFSQECENGPDNLSDGFLDLIRVWTIDRVGENCEFGDDFRLFFPLVSGELSGGGVAECGVGYLAEVVMVEAFWLRLCLTFGSRVWNEELQKDIQNCVVQTITGFQNCRFFDMLLRMLLEPSLPVAAFLSSQDEVFLRKALYDVVILVEYSFLKSKMWTQLPGDFLKNFALTWLLVADSAVQFVRESCDQMRSLSYIDAFSKSCLPNQLVKWVNDQTCLEEKVSRPNASTPKALIRWLLALEDQGVSVFDSKLHAKAVICRSKIVHQISESQPNRENLKDSIFTSIGNNWRGHRRNDEDQEMFDSLDDAFLPVGAPFFHAGCMGNPAVAEKRKTRGKGGLDEDEARFKLAKFNYPSEVGQPPKALNL